MKRNAESIVINRPCSTEPASIGRRGRMVMKIQGPPVELVDEMTEYQPGRVIAHRTVDGPFPLNTACLCDPVPEGCRATVVGAAGRRFGGVFAPLVEPFVARSVRRGFKADLVRLKSVLEADAAPAEGRA